MPRPGEGRRATTAWRMPTPRSTSCAYTCVWPTAGNGSTMASTNMSARSSPKSVASSAGGCGRRQSSNASVTRQGRRGALRPDAARFVYAPGGCAGNPADRMLPRHPTKLHRIPPAVANRTCRHYGDRRWMWDEHTGRKPILLLRLSGWLLLRFAARALSGLLFQPPPRNTRGSISGHPLPVTR